MKSLSNSLKKRIIIFGFLGISLAAGIEGLVINQKNKEIDSFQESVDNSNARNLDLAGKYSRLNLSKILDSAELVSHYNSEILSLQGDYIDVIGERNILEEEYIELVKKDLEKSKKTLELQYNLMESNREKEFYKEFSKRLDSTLNNCISDRFNGGDYF